MDFFARSDFPALKATFKLDLKATSVAKFRESAASALKLASASTYGCYVAAFQRDIIFLGGPGQKADVGENEMLPSAGIVPLSTIFFTAPGDKAPKKKHKKLRKKEEEEILLGDQAYAKTLTCDTVLSALKTTAKSGIKRTTALEFIDRHATKVFESKDFLTITNDTLLTLIKRDTLRIKEADLFDNVVRWGRAKAKDKESAEELKTILKDAIPLIRFSTMTTHDLASKVIPTSLLDTDLVLPLFTYLGMKGKDGDEEKVKLPDSLKIFNTKRRKGGGGRMEMKFDAATARNCAVTDEGRCATRSGSYESSVRGDKSFEDGDETYIEVKCTSELSWSGSFVFGVIPKSATVSQTCFNQEAWYCDIWHSHVRALSLTTDIPSFRGTDMQKTFSDNCEGRIMGMRYKPLKGTGGTLEWTLDGIEIPMAKVTISGYTPADLVPFFGIYGRCKSVTLVES